MKSRSEGMGALVEGHREADSGRSGESAKETSGQESRGLLKKQRGGLREREKWFSIPDFSI